MLVKRPLLCKHIGVQCICGGVYIDNSMRPASAYMYVCIYCLPLYISYICLFVCVVSSGNDTGGRDGGGAVPQRQYHADRCNIDAMTAPLVGPAAAAAALRRASGGDGPSSTDRSSPSNVVGDDRRRSSPPHRTFGVGDCGTHAAACRGTLTERGTVASAFRSSPAAGR